MTRKFAILILMILVSIGIKKQLDVNQIVIQEKTIDMLAEIKGEVNQPGTYLIGEEETLKSLIEKAKGLTEQADMSCLSEMMIIEHDSIIVIPKKTSKDKISLNSATAEQLMSLPGIGETKAEAIIAYRKNQTFKSLDEIMEVKGIGLKMFEKIKDLICL